MKLGIIILIYIISLVLQTILSTRKKYFWGLILPIIFAILFIKFRDQDLYNSLLIQLVILGVSRITLYIGKVILNKKRITNTNKSKIKDL